MRVKFTGFVDIPDGDVDSHCDVDHALCNRLETALLPSTTEHGAAEEILSFLDITWEVIEVPKPLDKG